MDFTSTAVDAKNPQSGFGFFRPRRIAYDPPGNGPKPHLGRRSLWGRL